MQISVSLAQECSDTTRINTLTFPILQPDVLQSYPTFISMPDEGFCSLTRRRQSMASSSFSDSAFVYRTTAEGVPIWVTGIGVEQGNEDYDFTSLTYLSDGGILVWGNVVFRDNLQHPLFSSIIKLNQFGTILWQKSYTDLNITSLQEGAHGDVVICGFSGFSQLNYTRLDNNGVVLGTFDLNSNNSSINFVRTKIFFTGTRLLLCTGFMDYDPSQGYQASAMILELSYASGVVLQSSTYHLNQGQSACDSLYVESASIAGNGNNLLLDLPGVNYSCNQPFHIYASLDASRTLPSVLYKFVAFAGGGRSTTIDYQLLSNDGDQYIWSSKYKEDPATTYLVAIDRDYNIITQKSVEKVTPTSIQVMYVRNTNAENFQGFVQTGERSFELIHLNKIAPSTKVCQMKDANFIFRQPIIVTPFSLQWSSEPSSVVLSSVSLLGARSISPEFKEICSTPSYCDQLKVLGDTSYCLTTNGVLFESFRNAECDKQTLWTIDSSLFNIEAQSDSTIRLTFKQSGAGYLKAQLEGCELKDSLFIHVVSVGGIFSLGSDTIMCSNSSMRLKAPSGYKEYLWQDGSKDSGLTVTQTGFYRLRVEDYCGNIFSDTIKVTFKSNCLDDLHFPNAFTPNGDGKNDSFRPEVNNRLQQFHLFIYNRWGQLVYSSSDPNIGWVGDFNGAPQSSGSYVYRCLYEFSKGRPQKAAGSFLLIR